MVIGAINVLWQMYVLLSGRARITGYMYPIVLIAVGLAMMYFGRNMETPPSILGGRR